MNEDGKFLKVIIVDDERRICELIQKIIDWGSVGMEVVGVFYDGVSALSAVRNLSPDIIISDILMPGFDGLELIQKIREINDKVEFLLISGHKNFEYAHSALKHGVRNYLLKPILHDDLYENLLSIRTRINDRRNAEQEQSLLEDQVEQNAGILKSKYIYDLVYNTQNLEFEGISHINKRYRTGFVEKDPYGFVFCAIRPYILDKQNGNNENVETLLLEKIESLFIKQIENQFIETICASIEGNVYALVNYKDRDECRLALQKAFEYLKVYFSDFAFITFGASGFDSKIKKGFIKEAKLSLEAWLDNDGDQIIYFEPKLIPSKERVGATIDKLHFLNETLLVQSADQVVNWFDESSSHLDVDKVSATEFFVIVNMMLHEISETFKGIRDISPEYIDEESIKKQVFSVLDRTKIIKLIEAHVIAAYESYYEKNRHQELYYIRQAKDYIFKHYQENISLASVAEKLNISPVYLSMLFSKNEENGATFIDFLIKCRIDRAKEFLKDPAFTIAQVGVMVGYPDNSYFSKVFFKMTGIKPNEYRKLYI